MNWIGPCSNLLLASVLASAAQRGYKCLLQQSIVGFGMTLVVTEDVVAATLPFGTWHSRNKHLVNCPRN